MRIIAITNQKGGTGKTTSTINIGAGLTRLGNRVLLIDLDPQANLSFSLGLGDPASLPNIYEVLKGRISLAEAVIEVNSMGLVPASPELVKMESEMASNKDKAALLQKALNGPLDWDYILLDCPPSYGLITLNALTAAQELYVPVQAEFLALQGMSKLLETIETVQREYNPLLRFSGIIATRYDQRRVLNREVIESLSEHFDDKLFTTLIHENIALAEAPSFGQDIFSYRPDSNGARDYMSLCLEIMERR
ncbi:MAG: ParA family protein [Deltaproteobacteria bacterium]